MLSADTVKALKAVQPQNVYIDQDMVNIQGKIGETTNLRKRMSKYYNCQNRNGMYERFETSKSSKTLRTMNRKNIIVTFINLKLFFSSYGLNCNPKILRVSTV
jgi:hypothetical protein